MSYDLYTNAKYIYIFFANAFLYPGLVICMPEGAQYFMKFISTKHIVISYKMYLLKMNESSDAAVKYRQG